MTIALETHGVTKIYHTGGVEIRAVDDVALQVEAGEFAALVGPSGSGKTTMLAILAGLLRPDRGQILIEGEELGQMKDARRTRFRGQKIGFVFQASNLLPYLTALENVELILKLTGQLTAEKQREAKKLLTRLGLGERLHNLPSQLSGGQQQRVAIARALVTQPAIVLADEPTGNLDSKSGSEILQLLRRTCDQQGQTIVMVTHDPRAAAYADRVVFLRDGQVVRELKPAPNTQAIMDVMAELEL